jgi:hypothetical protein
MHRLDLIPDCGQCAALCCVATSFDASEAFAFDKPAGVACHHLEGNRCAIHAELVEQGCAGCAAYDCYGAGQRVTGLFAGSGRSEGERDEAFLVLRSVHELIWLLTEAIPLVPSSLPDLRAELECERIALDALAQGPLEEVPLEAHERLTRRLLRTLGDQLRGAGGSWN